MSAGLDSCLSHVFHFCVIIAKQAAPSENNEKNVKHHMMFVKFDQVSPRIPTFDFESNLCFLFEPEGVDSRSSSSSNEQITRKKTKWSG